MKRTLVVTALMGALAVWFIVSPFIGISRLRTALETRDAQALSERIDFRRVQNSLSEQIVGTYLKISGRSQQLGILGGSLAGGIAHALTEPLVIEIVNSEGMLNFLGGKGGQSKSSSFPALDTATTSTWRLFLATEYGIGSVSVSLPEDADPTEQFRIRLQVIQWKWKLTAINLPERIRIELAKEFQKRIARN